MKLIVFLFLFSWIFSFFLRTNWVVKRPLTRYLPQRAMGIGICLTANRQYCVWRPIQRSIDLLKHGTRKVFSVKGTSHPPAIGRAYSLQQNCLQGIREFYQPKHAMFCQIKLWVQSSSTYISKGYFNVCILRLFCLVLKVLLNLPIDESCFFKLLSDRKRSFTR